MAAFQDFRGEFLRHPLRPKGVHKSILDVVINDPPSATLVQSSSACLGVSIQNVYAHWEEFFKLNYKEDNLEYQVMHYYFDYYNALVGDVAVWVRSADEWCVGVVSKDVDEKIETYSGAIGRNGGCGSAKEIG